VQPSLWESVLPEVCLRLPVELARVDAWLDDERFFAPFVPHFPARMGRPSVPMETYLRLMFLKHRYRLGYESLCAEVSDSISWRRFCRIDIDGELPHPEHPDEDHHPVRGAGDRRPQQRTAHHGLRGEGG